MSKHPDGIEVYKRLDGITFGWRYFRKGKITATDTGQGYRRRGEMLDIAARTLGGLYERDAEGERIFRPIAERMPNGDGWFISHQTISIRDEDAS